MTNSHVPTHAQNFDRVGLLSVRKWTFFEESAVEAAW